MKLNVIRTKAWIALHSLSSTRSLCCSWQSLRGGPLCLGLCSRVIGTWVQLDKELFFFLTKHQSARLYRRFVSQPIRAVYLPTRTPNSCKLSSTHSRPSLQYKQIKRACRTKCYTAKIERWRLTSTARHNKKRNMDQGARHELVPLGKASFPPVTHVALCGAKCAVVVF